MKSTHCTFILALAAIVLLSEAALAQVYLPPQPEVGRRGHITVAPFFAGPAVVTDEVDPHVGLSLTGGFNFSRSRFFCMGIDACIGYGVPVEVGAGVSRGSWTMTSIGLPIRIGGSVAFYFRPALSFDILDHYQYDITVGGDKWEIDFDSSVAFGLNLGFGLDFNFHRRFSFGVAFMTEFLPVYHEGTAYWNGGWDYDMAGWLTICGQIRFMIIL
jgi:opacity protein-like surface antigen